MTKLELPASRHARRQSIAVAVLRGLPGLPQSLPAGIDVAVVRGLPGLPHSPPAGVVAVAAIMTEL